MAYYKVSDRKIIEQASFIAEETYQWQNNLIRLAKQYGFDRLVVKGGNLFHQYALLEFAIHESKRYCVDEELYEAIDSMILASDESSVRCGLLSGKYIIFTPKDKSLCKEIQNKLLKIGTHSPNLKLLQILCPFPEAVKRVYHSYEQTEFGAVDRIVYVTDQSVDNNYQFCEKISEIEFQELANNLPDTRRFAQKNRLSTEYIVGTHAIC